MLFWIFAALMTFAATVALLLPFAQARGERVEVAPEAHDIEVYRDQLSEIDRDLAAGQINVEDAGVARGEIGRRLIAVARKGEAGTGRSTSRWLPRYALIGVLVFMPATALVTYLQLGAPGAGQMPFAARMNQDPGRADINTLIANAERQLAANPDEGRGWDVLAPIYLRIGRVDDAETAFRAAIRLLGPSASRQAGLGEALVSKSGGVVTDEARLVFQSARELNPEDPRPAFFLALARAQEGKLDEARTEFVDLLDRSDKDAPWVPAIRQQIAALDSAVRDPALSNGPSAADIAAAMANKTPEQRTEMIRTMVGTLENRLADNPDNIDGWLMLIRSKMILEDQIGAQEALDRAVIAFPNIPQANLLSDLAQELSLKLKAELGGLPLPPVKSTTEVSKDSSDQNAGPFIVPESLTAATEDTGKAVPTGSSANPTQADIAAAALMSDDDRKQMIRGMVASLDEKLRQTPDNLEGWLRLIRSYVVLGELENGRDALDRAKAAFVANAEASATIARLGAELALGKQE